jgi:hypothetical protein
VYWNGQGFEPKISRSLRKEKYTSPKFQHEWVVSSSGIGTCATVDWAKRPLEGELLETVHPYQLVAWSILAVHCCCESKMLKLYFLNNWNPRVTKEDSDRPAGQTSCSILKPLKTRTTGLTNKTLSKTQYPRMCSTNMRNTLNYYSCRWELDRYAALGSRIRQGELENMHVPCIVLSESP